MKTLVLLLSVVTIFVLIGCSDQSSISTVAGPTAIASKAMPQPQPEQGQWDIKCTVNGPGLQDFFLVEGVIKYSYLVSDLNFTFSNESEIEIRTIKGKKDFVSSSARYTHQGKAVPKSPIVVSETVSLNTIRPGLFLVIEYLMDDAPHLQKMYIKGGE